MTDSGNIAEEATFLDVPCITLNTYAEHPETWRIGTNELVGQGGVLPFAVQQLVEGGGEGERVLPDKLVASSSTRPKVS